MMHRPTALTVNATNIPDALKSECRWTTWRYNWKANEGTSGRWIKLPQCKTNDSSTWTTFAEAFARYERGGYDGVGFVLGDGWAGLDLDHCTKDDAPGIFERLAGSYMETSPSGTGYKVIGRSPRIGGEFNFAVRPTARTTWTGARYFAVTGQGSGDPTVDLTAFLDDWFKLDRPSASPPPSFIKPGLQGHESLVLQMHTDDDVLVLAATATNGLKFRKLYRGDTSEYGGDLSRADQALLSILAYWCSGDRDQIDRLYRQSGLMRPKWHVRSYRLASLNKAVARV